jgi:hypothetical protein
MGQNDARRSAKDRDVCPLKRKSNKVVKTETFYQKII